MAKYLKEVEGKEFFTSEKGFAIYTINDGVLFIENLEMIETVTKEDSNEFINSVITIGKNAGCNMVTGRVNSERNKATQRVLAHIRRGYKIAGTDGVYVIMYKEI